MRDFPSMKARDLLAVLMRELLRYEIVRQRGSHRRLAAPGRPSITFAFPRPRARRSARSCARTWALVPMRLSSYCDAAVRIRVLYHLEAAGWWAESPDIDGWTVAGDTFEQVRELVDDGVRFTLAAAAEENGEGFDEGRFTDLAIEHYVPAPA